MKILMNYADYSHTEDRFRQNEYGGLGYYRIIKPAQQIQGHEVVIVGREITQFGKTLTEQWDNIFKEFDVFWTNYFKDDYAGAAIIYHAQKHKKKFIVDVDDNYFDLPESNLLYDEYKSGKRSRAMMSTILSFADAITTSTEPLQKRIKEHIKNVHGIDKPVFLVPNMNDVADWNYEPAKKRKSRITIGYSGSNSHQDDLKMVMPAIKAVMTRHPNVWFELIGAVSKDKVPELFFDFPQETLNRIGLLPATATFKEYPHWLADQKWDIGIAPLVDTAFTRSKSHIKWMEYSMYKIPTIASRTYPYFMDICGRETITHEETGLLCRPNEWEKALERLIADENLRKELGNNAYEHIKKNWQYKNGPINEVVHEMLK